MSSYGYRFWGRGVNDFRWCQLPFRSSSADLQGRLDAVAGVVRGGGCDLRGSSDNGRPTPERRQVCTPCVVGWHADWGRPRCGPRCPSRSESYRRVCVKSAANSGAIAPAMFDEHRRRHVLLGRADDRPLSDAPRRPGKASRRTARPSDEVSPPSSPLGQGGQASGGQAAGAGASLARYCRPAWNLIVPPKLRQ